MTLHVGDTVRRKYPRTSQERSQLGKVQSRGSLPAKVYVRWSNGRSEWVGWTFIEKVDR